MSISQLEAASHVDPVDKDDPIVLSFVEVRLSVNLPRYIKLLYN